LLNGKQSTGFSRTHENVENCYQGSQEPSDMASRESI
jgi:hypothetical protein